jgi:flagellar assembly factor FliW
MSSAELLGNAELTFPAGIVGMPSLVRFSVQPLDGPIVELVSLDDASFGFLAIPGELARPGLGGILREQGLATADEDVLVVLSIHGEPPAVTANLVGPLVVAADGTSRQLVVEHAELSVRAPLPTAGE